MSFWRDNKSKRKNIRVKYIQFIKWFFIIFLIISIPPSIFSTWRDTSLTNIQKLIETLIYIIIMPVFFALLYKVISYLYKKSF